MVWPNHRIFYGDHTGKGRQHFHAAITLTMARFDEEECFAKPIKQDLQKQILCQLNKVFQREVESVWEQDARLKEVIHEIRTLKDNIREMVFGVYRGPLPSYFHSVIQGIENANWKTFFVQRVLVYHDRVNKGGSMTMNLKGERGPKHLLILKNSRHSK